VFSLASTAVENARQGKGPQFIELSTYRWREHCGPDFDDHLGYRATQEIEIGLKDCPIAKYIAKLKQSNILSQAESEKFEAEIAEEVSDAFKFALSSLKPSAKDAAERIYA
jgi:pyruvate dehydrogenase E1 component alpha subunit